MQIMHTMHSFLELGFTCMLLYRNNDKDNYDIGGNYERKFIFISEDENKQL